MRCKHATDRVSISTFCPHLSDHFFHDWTGAAGESSAQLQLQKRARQAAVWLSLGRRTVGCRQSNQRVEARRKSCLVTCVFFSTKEVLFSRKINEEGSEPFPFTKKEDLRTGTAINRMIVTVVLVWC